MKLREKKAKTVPEVVFDSSAILALVHRERGAEIVQLHAGSGVVSAVNVGELSARLIDRGMSESQIRTVLDSIGVAVVPFDEEQAYMSAALRSHTRRKGLSLGDRACLALAKLRGIPALTADRIWATIDVGVDIRLIRGN